MHPALAPTDDALHEAVVIAWILMAVLYYDVGIHSSALPHLPCNKAHRRIVYELEQRPDAPLPCAGASLHGTLCRAQKSNLKDLMTEFQELRSKMNREYKEVVERRYDTGEPPAHDPLSMRPLKHPPRHSGGTCLLASSGAKLFTARPSPRGGHAMRRVRIDDLCLR